MEDDTTTPTGWHHETPHPESEPNPAALGILAIVIALLSAILALTYPLILLAYLGAIVALALGVLALGDDRSRALGAGAIAVAAFAAICATVVLVSL